MKCPHCSAECADQANECEFCGHVFPAGSPEAMPPLPPESADQGPPEIPDFAPPPLPSNFESDNPYAASDSSSYGHAQVLPAHEIPNHLALSITSAILTLCCCCIPFGIVPVIFSTQVNSKLAIGDYAGAQSASQNAKLWSMISIGIALAVFMLNMIFSFATEFLR